jgi:hypothetical protein
MLGLARLADFRQADYQVLAKIYTFAKPFYREKITFTLLNSGE